MNFAIIIPIYNVKDYLAECLESVFDQDYENLQIICIDDGSDDGSFDIVYNYFLKDERITIIQKPNGGLSQARNTGLDFLLSKDMIKINANKPLCGEWRGYKIFLHNLPFYPDYIHFLDSDDTFEKDCIKECAKLFTENEIDIVWHDFYFFYQKNNFIDKTRVFPFDIGTIPSISIPQMLEKIQTKHFNFGWHGALKTKLVENIRFVEGIEYEDVSFAFFLFSQASNIALLDKQLIRYRVREGSITNSKNIKQYPPYMKDLEGYFQTFQEAKFYSFFYSDCINILEADAFLTQLLPKKKGGGDEKDLRIIVEKFREMLNWRTFIFLSVTKHKIKTHKDPRGCKELYKKICQRGYGGSFSQIISFRLQAIKKHYSNLFRIQTRNQLSRIKIIIKKILSWK